MDRNVFLAFVLSFLVMTGWIVWQAEHRPPPGTKPEAAATKATETGAQQGPSKAVEGGGEAKSAEAAAAPAPPGAKAATEGRLAALEAPGPVPPPAGKPQIIPIDTSLFHAELSATGAGLVRFALEKYRVSTAPSSAPVELAMVPRGQVALGTPMRGLGLGDLDHAVFRVVKRSNDGVTFEYTRDGVRVRKAFEFDPHSYAFRVTVSVYNGSKKARSPEFAVDWPVRVEPKQHFASQAFTALSDGSLERIQLGGFGKPGIGTHVLGRPVEREKQFGGGVAWAGVQTRYFLGVVIPAVPRDARAYFGAVSPGKVAVADVGYPAFSLPPGASIERDFRAFIGPKERDRLDAVGENLDRSIYVGWSWFAPLTRAFIWMLQVCHGVIPNYGLAIIVLTVLVRAVTAPLATKQMRSMRRMGQLQPKIKELQEKFKDDRQAQTQAMMKIYREAGVNPLGGCLPMLFQIPVFIGLYYALESSIHLRHAPFFGWIQDLSAPEALFTLPALGLPVRLLPLLMGGSMVAQQRLTPSTMDPTQARMMATVMPVVFTAMFYQFPSGLVLYWLVSNLLAVAQQVWINRQLGDLKS